MRVPIAALLLLMLGSTTFVACAEDDEEITTPSAAVSPVEPLPVPDQQTTANSKSFTLREGLSQQEKNECRAKVQAYLDKQACMNRYRTQVRVNPQYPPADPTSQPVVRSGIKPEAFTRCGADVAYPIECPIQELNAN